MPLLPGEELGSYEILSAIGAGGIGISRPNRSFANGHEDKEALR